MNITGVVRFDSAGLAKQLTQAMQSPGTKKALKLMAEDAVEVAILKASGKTHGEETPHEFAPTEWLTAAEFNKGAMP